MFLNIHIVIFFLLNDNYDAFYVWFLTVENLFLCFLNRIIHYFFFFVFLVTLDTFELHVSTRNRVPLTRASWSRRFRRICRTATERTLAYIAGHTWPTTTNLYRRYVFIIVVHGYFYSLREERDRGWLGKHAGAVWVKCMGLLDQCRLV